MFHRQIPELYCLIFYEYIEHYDIEFEENDLEF